MSFRQLITGVILRWWLLRLNGQDKGLANFYRESRSINIFLARLQPQVGEVLINANRNQPRYSESQLTVISDLNNHFSGPLAECKRLYTMSKQIGYCLCLRCSCSPSNLAENVQ